MRLKREMNATSSQDEFAKWAKMRRNHDKILAQYDEKSKNSRRYKRESTEGVLNARLMNTFPQQTISSPSNQPLTAPSLLSAGSVPTAFASSSSSGFPNDRSSGYRGVGCRVT